MADILQGTPTPASEQNLAASKDLPAWYQQYTANLGGQAAGLARNLNNQPLPMASVAGFNDAQKQAFGQVQAAQGAYTPDLQAARRLNAQIAPTSAMLVDYAQGAVGAPAMETGSSIQPWAQGAQDAASGSASEWTQNYQKYMSPYTTQVVDNIARLGKRNFEDNIMPGVNRPAMLTSSAAPVSTQLTTSQGSKAWPYKRATNLVQESLHRMPRADSSSSKCKPRPHLRGAT